MKTILKTQGLSKKYNSTFAVSNLDMEIQTGEIYGFLGPNGAGKTTVMKMLANLIPNTSGEIEIFAEQINPSSHKYLKDIGLIIETPIFYDYLNAYDTLKLHCDYMGYKRDGDIERALTLVNLQETKRKKVNKFSLGMKQRLGIARAIVTRPKLLLLDEPINGLDPIGIKEIRDLLKRLSKEEGVTVFISSHILSEIEHLADRIGIIKSGKLVEEVTMKELIRDNTKYTEIKTDDASNALNIIKSDFKINDSQIVDGNKVRIFNTSYDKHSLIKALVSNNIRIDTITDSIVSLEDHFIKIMNGGGNIV